MSLSLSLSHSLSRVSPSFPVLPPSSLPPFPRRVCRVAKNTQWERGEENALAVSDREKGRSVRKGRETEDRKAVDKGCRGARGVRRQLQAMRGSVDQAWPFTAEYTAVERTRGKDRERIGTGREKGRGARKRESERARETWKRDRDRSRDEENTGKRRERERRMKRLERESETTYFGVVRDSSPRPSLSLP